MSQSKPLNVNPNSKNKNGFVERSSRDNSIFDDKFADLSSLDIANKFLNSGDLGGNPDFDSTQNLNYSSNFESEVTTSLNDKPNLDSRGNSSQINIAFPSAAFSSNDDIKLEPNSDDVTPQYSEHGSGGFGNDKELGTVRSLDQTDSDLSKIVEKYN